MRGLQTDYVAQRSDQKQNTGVRRLEGRAAESLAGDRNEVQAYDALAEEVGAAPGTLTLACLLTRSAVTTPIIGPRTRDQVDSALPAVEDSLSPEHLHRLDEFFPGDKTAPEDYARWPIGAATLPVPRRHAFGRRSFNKNASESLRLR